MKNQRDCDICSGMGTLRLPIRQRLAAFTAADVELRPVELSRLFPCPECSGTVSLRTVSAARVEQNVDSRVDERGFISHVHEGLACKLADFLLRNGYIQFERGEIDANALLTEFRASMAVAHPSNLDTLEQRISERQSEVAQEVVSEAIKQIDNWGSEYGYTDILKRDARTLIRDSVTAVLEQHAKRWKPALEKQQ